MKKILLKWLLPSVLDLADKILQEWIDDPKTTTEDNMIDAVKAYLKYLGEKALG